MRDRFLHPFLITAFPILAQFAYNKLHFNSLHLLLLPLAVSFTGVLLLFLILRIFLKDINKAAIVCTLLSFSFFAYGPLFDVLAKHSTPFISLQPSIRHLLILVCAIIFLWLLLLFFIRVRANLKPVNGFLNVVAIIALAQPVVMIAAAEVEIYQLKREFASAKPALLPNLSEDTVYPDIYYIMMDGYGREDVLKDLYNYDNSPFILYLRNKGFYVADCSRSNYAHTAFSQAATLNMRYVQDIFPEQKSNRIRDLAPAITYNDVFRFVKALGYKTVSFDAAIAHHVQITDTDIFYRTPAASGFSLDHFHYLLLSQTPLRVMMKRFINDNRENFDVHRHKILHGFRRLKERPDVSSPVFVYAHFLAPHFPHVFGPKGQFVSPQVKGGIHRIALEDTVSRNHYKQAYINELHYLNGMLIETIDTILGKSTNPPVIIIQSDHGPDARMDINSMQRSDLTERLSNLFAIYLPGQDTSQLYAAITPVNTFPVVFNHLFKAGLPLLPDKSYYSVHSSITDFKEVAAPVCRTQSIAK